jgi:NHLM bacteriocin system ABC transporter ATP-binding protein
MTSGFVVPDTRLVRTFRETGEVVLGGGDRPLDLTIDTILLVISGALDVFAVPTGSDGAVSRRYHLFRVGHGAAVFGCRLRSTVRRFRLLAVGAGRTEVVRVSWLQLQHLAGGAVFDSDLVSLMEGWVGAVHKGFLARLVPPARSIELEPGGDARLDKGAAIRTVSGVSWVQHLEGESRLLGQAPLRVNGTGWLPVAQGCWLEASEASRIRSVATQSLPLEERWTGLRQLHELVLGYAGILVHRQEAEERNRLRIRAESDRAVVEHACRRLAATLHQSVSLSMRAPEPHDPLGATFGHELVRCCRQVADTRGIRIRSGPAPLSDGPVAALRALARASRFRIRQVALRGEWWRSECGAMVAFRGEHNQPVALIPDARGGYVLHDGLEGVPRRLDSAGADSLSPRAFTFYPPFPERAIGLRDMLGFGLLGSRRDLAVLVLTGIMVGLLGLMVPVATGMIFNTVIPAADRGQLVQLVLVLLVSTCSSAMFQLTRGIAQLRIEGRMSALIQAAVWDRLLSLPMSFFRSFSAGDLAVRAMAIDTIRQAISGATLTALLGGLFSVFNFGLLFFYSVRLALWAMLLAAVAVLVTVLVSWAQLRFQRQIATYQQEISGQVLQFLGSIAKLHVAGSEPHVFAAWARKFSAQRALQYRARRIGNTLATFNAAFPVLSMAVIFAAAAPLLHGEPGLRTGDFLAFISSFTIFLSAILSMAAAVVSVLAVVPLYENARPILETAPEVDEAKTDPGALSGEIEVAHLSFRYDPAGPLILRDLAFHARAGEFVAFVGPSGTGKSTIFRLLLGFEKPESGAIYFDGQEVGGLDAQAVRQQIGVVLQNGRLMPGDIFTNIVGSTAATLEDAWRAASMAGLEEDIRQMPMGMHTVISEGGSTLSGGQRQRLMIARAVVNRPRILLFDEATSALDNRTQAIVSQSLEKLQATRLVIAHRLSTIINADRILYFDGGRIVESGSYTELLESRGRFAELAARQLA